MNTDVAVGFYGKLPSLGDFVGRRVPERVVERWDHWLQESVAASRASLGERWLDLYLTAPMWRFFANRGVLGSQPVGGVVFPSVDRVGRYFPVTVFATLPDDAVGLVVADRCARWFERVEDLVLAQLDDESRDIEEFEEALAATGTLLLTDLGTVAARSSQLGFPEVGDDRLDLLHVPLGDRLDVGPAALTWLDQMVVRSMSDAVFWWSSGSSSVRPSWLVTRGLPQPAAFGSMLTGEWHDWPWSSCEMPSALATSPAALLHLESAGSTHPGKVRSENQDAYVAQPESGLWVVADGMGGHSEGQVASRMVCDALAAVGPQPSLAAAVRAVLDALAHVNGYLYSMSRREIRPVVSGTTVVALLVRGARAACLWAGDSRLYRLRDDVLEQLSTDHSEEVEGPATAGMTPRSNVITRAIGGCDELEVEQCAFDVRVGDRLLLCSDGLYREMSTERIAELIRSGDAISVVETLLQHALRAEAADNVTVVVVDVQPGSD
jgi:type VI secretion system protein ImpM